MSRDRKYHELLNDYAERPPADLRDRIQERLAEGRRRSRRAVTFRWASVGAFAAALALFVLIVAPRQADAAKLRRVHQAIASAKSVRLTLSKDAGGAKKPVLWLWKKDDKLRLRKCLKPEDDVTYVVNDGVKYTYQARDFTATQEPYAAGSESDLDADLDPVEVAKAITEPDNSAGTARVESRPDVDGREVFAIVYERTDGGFRAELTVDARTNLPTSMAVDTESPSSGAKGSGVWDLSFNEELSPKLFEPVFGPEVKIVIAPARPKPTSESVERSQPGAFSALDGTPCEAEVLYRIRFGSRDNELGVVLGPGSPDGPAGFAVRKGGGLIVADRVNRKVKEFDIHGSLVLVTEGTLDSPLAVAPGPDGSVFVVSGKSAETLTRFDRRGVSVWRVEASEVLPDNLRPAGGFGEIGAAEDGSVAVSLNPGPWLLTLGPNGAFRSVRQARAMLPDGRLVAVLPVADDPAVVDAVTLDAAGCLLSNVALKPMEVDGSIAHREDIGTVATQFDESGSWYRVWTQRRSKRLDVGDRLRIRSEAVLTKYGPDGAPVAQGVVDVPPFGYSQVVAPSADGTVYGFAFGPDRVFVIRYRLP